MVPFENAPSSYINNSLKNAQGMLAGFAHSKSVARKRALEADLTIWIAADPELEALWGDALTELEALVEEERATSGRDQVFASLKYNQMWSAPTKGYRLARERELPDVARSPGYQERDMARTRGFMARMARNYDPQVDQAILAQIFERYAALPPAVRLEALDEWFGLDGEVDPAEAIAAKLDAMYADTTLVDADARLALLDAERAEFEASEDPFVQLATAMYDILLQIELDQEAIEGRLLEARPRFMEALLAYQRAMGNEIYPDANSTLRVTFGNVVGYAPRDATVYLPFEQQPADTPWPDWGHEDDLLVVTSDGQRGFVPRASGTMRATLRVDESHPFFFDHPLDHIPGTLLIEGVWQLLEHLPATAVDVR